MCVWWGVGGENEQEPPHTSAVCEEVRGQFLRLVLTFHLVGLSLFPYPPPSHGGGWSYSCMHAAKI